MGMKIFGIVVAGVIVSLLWTLFLGWVVMLAWNFAIVAMGAPTIGYWHAVVAVILLSILSHIIGR